MKYETSFLSETKRISARLRIPEGDGPFPSIIINHGYSGDKQEYDEMASFLSECGYLTLQFDSRGCGESEAQKGAMLCSTEWIEDAINAVSFVCLLEKADKNKIGYTGNSMGGCLTIYMAAMDKRIKAAVAMAPVIDGAAVIKNSWMKNRGEPAYLKFLDELKMDSENVLKGKKSRYVSVPYALGMCDKDENDYILERSMHAEMVSHVPLESVYNSFMLFNVSELFPKISIPLLLVHGDKDSLIPIHYTADVAAHLNKDCRFIIVKGGIHALPTSDKAFEIFNIVKDWFDFHLNDKTDLL